ncbi:hypothetical protein [Methanotorris formicicus]|uniref:Uncharacterized protein n=1 Tax=Methanotorris formicicus Mc-S-70 TaxID=647171 RepID=H1KWF9_9EURY|nr:hypothetical protein [Methanotorris formicicus]EHP89536.1 hypothetical protein MetfoDRAFT_0132 [Methanotorris formicicus Mc-S-70]
MSDDENYKKILEAFWRAKRDEFDIEDINRLKNELEECILKLEKIIGIKRKIYEIGADLKFTDEEENIISSLEGLEELNN